MHKIVSSLPAFLAAGLALGLAQQVAAAGQPALVRASLDRGAAHQTGELLVQFQPGASATAKSRALSRVGAAAVERVRGPNRLEGELARVRVPAAMPLEQAMRKLEEDGAVSFAEPNWIYQHAATFASNDTYYTNGSLWGMYGATTSPANQYGSHAAAAWAAGNTCGANPVYVGIIDEGVMITHEDLAANIGVNPFDSTRDGVDNDGNGLVDDVNGWDFDGNNSTVFDGVDDNHGTHVAGTIGAVGGNGKGVAGMCWNVKMLSAKFLGKRGGTTANAIKAVDYFTDLKARHGINLVATNNSWGGGGFSQALANAIADAGDANILFIAAAGNSAVDNDEVDHYPASYSNESIIAVASITSTGALSSFSNYGVTTVDIGAPGSGIWSTVPKSAKGKVVPGYASLNGTSMATPHVTGAAAMYASKHPAATALEIKAAILGSGLPTASLAGKTVTGDRLNVSGF